MRLLSILPVASFRAFLRPALMRKVICIGLVFALLLSGLKSGAANVEESSPAQAETAAKKPTIREQAIEIEVGTATKVRLQSKEKLRGRMGTISDEGFVLQVAKGNQIEDRKIAFDEVRSLKKIQGWSTASKVAVGVLAVLGVLIVIGIAAASGALSN